MTIKLVLALLAGSVFVAVGAMEEREKRFNFETLKEVSPYDDSVYSLFVSDDGRVVIGSYFGILTIVDKERGTSLSFTGHKKTGPIYSVFVHEPKGQKKFIIAGSFDPTAGEGKIRIWRMNGKLVRSIIQPKNAVYSVFATKNEVVSGWRDKTVKIFDMKTGALIKTLEGHADAVACVAVMPGGDVVSGSRDGFIKVWDTKTDKERVSFRACNEKVNCLVIYKNLIISGLSDNTVKIWDINGTLLQTLNGDSEVFTVFAYANMVVAGFGDGTIKIWKLDGTLLHTLDKGAGEVRTVFVCDGDIFVGYGNGLVGRWKTRSVFESKRHQEFKTKLLKSLQDKPEESDVRFEFKDLFSN